MLLTACAGIGNAQVGGAQNQAQENPHGAPPIESRVSIVSLDIVVTDAAGHAVHGLKASDFTVLESGQKMTLQSFEEHRADQVQPVPPQPRVELPANVFTNFAGVRNKGPLNVLLLDTLNTRLEDQGVVRQMMLDYLEDLPEGTEMAVFGLSNQLLLLQGFTTDPEVLKAVLKRKANSKQSLLLTTPQDADANRDMLLDLIQIGASPQVVMDVEAFQAETTSEQTAIRIKDTIDAMNELARYLSGFPGRKNLIWFSGSFPLNVAGTFPQDMGPALQVPHTNRFGAAVESNFEDDLKTSANLLARA